MDKNSDANARIYINMVPHFCQDGSSGMPVVPATISDSDHEILLNKFQG